MSLATIVGDGKSSDQIARLYGGAGGFKSKDSAKRISRFCDCPFRAADDPYHSCKLYREEQLEQLCNVALNETLDSETRKVAGLKLNHVSTHVCHNAFKDVDFGENPWGVLFACTTDMMHMFELGLLVYILVIFVNSMTNAVKADMDRIIDSMFQTRSSFKSRHLRWNFTRGSTSVSLLTAKEWPGLAMAYLCVLLTEEGRRRFTSCFKEDDTEIEYDDSIVPVYPRTDANLPSTEVVASSSTAQQAPHGEEEADDDEEEDVDEAMLEEILGETTKEKKKKAKKVAPLNCSHRQFCHLIEELLAFHAYYKAPTTAFRHDATDQEKGILDRRIRRMLHRVKLFTPRLEGNGYKIKRFHEFTHSVQPIDYYGCPDNFDASHGESFLKFFAKFPASTSQKRKQSTFLKQVSQRIHAENVFQKARDDWDKCYKVDGDKEPVKMGVFNLTARFLVAPNESNNRHVSEWLSDNNYNVDAHPLICKWFRKKGIERTVCWTNYRFDADTILRCHPNHCSEGPWYDYCWLELNNVRSVAIILCFYKCGDTVKALVVSSVQADKRDIMSRWMLEVRRRNVQGRKVFLPKVRSVSTDDIKGGCMAVVEPPYAGTTLLEEYQSGRPSIWCLESRERWGGNFMTSNWDLRSRPVQIPA